MTGSMKAALCAAASLACASAAQAATIFEFRTTGSGTATALGANNQPQSVPLVDLVFQFRVSDQQPIFATSTGQQIATSLGGGQSTAQGVSFTERGPDITAASLTACFDNPSGLFPTAPASIAVTCGGSVSYEAQGSGVGYFGRYTGTVTGLVVYRADENAVKPTGLIVATIPEPASWALMLAGFGLTGYALRRRSAKVGSATLA